MNKQSNFSKIPVRRPWLFIPTLYFAEGLPYIIVNAVSVVLYKNFDVSNKVIGLTSILMWPWVIKMLWAPFVDTHSTKRNWIIFMQICIGIGLIMLAGVLKLSAFLFSSLIIFLLIAFFSATHDIAIDGFYMLALDKKMQAFYVGVRSTFYRLSVIFGSGLLVVLAGNLQKNLNNIVVSWQIVMAFTGFLFILAFLFHRFYLPYPVTDIPGKSLVQRESFLEIFASYLKQKKIIPIIIFILVYRLGEAVLEKMSPAFMLDKPEAGGLGLSTETFGLVKGTAGVISLTVGGLLGGWLISKFGLKKCIWPMALMLKIPDIVYVYMSIHKPGLLMIYLLVAFEQFGYGIGFTAFMVFLMYIAKGRYKTSHYAISTGIMALGMMVPGMLSGFLQSALGYTKFFILVLFLTIPGLLTLFFIPLDNPNQKG